MSEKMQHKIMKRNVSGILLLDKPKGFTSNQALQVVKKLFCANKAGHTGSLDPLASGMLPICFGEATKFSNFLLNANKHYWVVCKLGVVTKTGDAEGEIVAKNPLPELNEKKIKKVLEKFQGEIEQIPSMYSAIKHEGQPLYKLARKGIEVERKARVINIYQLNFLDFQDDLLTIEVYCSKGTYVRTLAEDIGKELGCGASVWELRRTAVDPFLNSEQVSLEKIKELAEKKDFIALDQLILPIEKMLKGIKELILSEASSFYLRQGNPVLVPDSPKEGLLILKNKKGEFLGVGEVDSNGKIAPRRLIKTNK
jgi:tRNA pseudouridine55 synthase